MMAMGKHRAGKDKAPDGPLRVVRATRTDTGVGMELSDGQVAYLCHTEEVGLVVEALMHQGPYRDEDGERDLPEPNRAYWAAWFHAALENFPHYSR